MKALFLTVLLFLMGPLSLLSGSSITDLVAREEVQDAVQSMITAERAFLQRGLNNASVYLPVVEEICREEGLPEELNYLPLIESAFSVRAYSRAGASGIWQFIPSTARWYNLVIDFWVDERRDPEKATRQAARHLSDLYDYYGNWELALAAYNAGMGAVNLAVKRGGTDFWVLREKKLLKRETREYVPRFIAAAHIAMNREEYGFTFEDRRRFSDFEILEIEKPVDLTVLCSKSSIPMSDLKFFNPELMRLITPVGRSYRLRVPIDRFAAALRTYLDLPKEELVGVKKYTVRFGDTLGEIAEEHGTSLSLLIHLNSVRNTRKIYAGDILLVPIQTEETVMGDDFFYVPMRGFHTQEILYTIRKGDTVWDIAKRYESDIETILALNGMTFKSVIVPGDEIILWIDTAYQP